MSRAPGSVSLATYSAATACRSSMKPKNLIAPESRVSKWSKSTRLSATSATANAGRSTHTRRRDLIRPRDSAPATACARAATATDASAHIGSAAKYSILPDSASFDAKSANGTMSRDAITTAACGPRAAAPAAASRTRPTGARASSANHSPMCGSRKKNVKPADIVSHGRSPSEAKRSSVPPPRSR